MRKTKGFFIALGLVASLVVIGVAGWQFDWWLQGKNVDKKVQIQNHNKGTQTAWMDEARNSITDYDLVDPSNMAARGALRIKACGLIQRLTGPYLGDDLLAFQSKECN